MAATSIPTSAYRGAPTGALSWRVGLAVLALLISPSAHTGVTLPLTDWLNRGCSFQGAVDPVRSLVYVALDRTEADDLAVFRYTGAGLAEYLGTVQGFGDSPFPYGGFAGSVLGSAGLVLWDPADPLKPRRVTNLPGPIPSYSAPVRSGNRMVAFEGFRVRLIDLGPPEAPRPVTMGLLDGVSAETGVFSGDLFFALHQDTGTYTLTALDFSDPAHPAKRWEHRFESPILARNAGGAVLGIFQNGRYLVASNRSEDQLHVFDVSDPFAPRKLASHVDPQLGMHHMATVDDTRFVTSRVRMYEVSADGAIRALSPAIEAGSPIQVVPALPFVMVTGWYTDLTVVDFSDPTSPRVTARVDPHAYAPDVLMDGTDLYAMGSRWTDAGFASAQPDAYHLEPAEGRLVRVPFQPPGRLWAVQDREMVLTRGSDLALFRRESADAPRFIARIESVWGVENVDLNGTLLRVSHAAQTRIFDVRDPSQPRLVSSFPVGTDGTFPGRHDPNLQLFAHYLASRDGSGTLTLWDVMRPAAGPVQTYTETGRLSRSRDRLWFATPKGLHVLGVAPEGALVETTVPVLQPYATWNFTADDAHLAVWISTTAAIYRILSQPDGRVHLRRIGTDSIPACLCHGGWYGTMAGGFLLTADAFAGVSVLRLPADGDIDTARPRVEILTRNGAWQVRYPTETGRQYRLHHSIDLRTWQPIQDPVAGDGQVQQLPVSPRAWPGGHAFFRVETTQID